jgi:O-antigen biosynthesis protein WbqV
MPVERLRSWFNRTYLVATHDVVMAAAAFVLALLLRRGIDDFWNESRGFFSQGLILFTVIGALVFWRTRIYRGLWRYTSLSDVLTIVKAASLVVLIFLPALFAITRLEQFPRSSLVITWIILMALLIGPRVAYRLMIEHSVSGLLQNGGAGRSLVLLVGAGDGADQFIRSTTSGAARGYRVVGVLDDDSRKIGLHLRGVRVFGPLSALPDVLHKLRRQGLRPHRLIVADERLAPEAVGALVAAAEGFGLSFARLPRLTDFQTADQRAIELTPIAIEDLLGRPQTVLDRAAMETLIKGRRVAVTGAGGTIGAELTRQIAAFAPASLTLIEQSEFNLYTIDTELAETWPHLSREAVLADVRDRGRLDACFACARPELVFHAAALKHVPMVEAHPLEGVLTNAIGTRNVVDACLEAKVALMVLISTDKAVEPTSVMGATKRIAEAYCQARGSEATTTTRFVTVRFGNVLDSSGSVVPRFRRQIAAGGPVTVTDPEVTRFFMTTREAVQLVLQASALGKQSESRAPAIFVLDMGRPIRILDLARQMIRLAGRYPERDIAIQFIGLKPGEKLHEELFDAGEQRTETGVAGIWRALPRPLDGLALTRQMEELALAARARQSARTEALLQAMVPEYRPAQPTEPAQRPAQRRVAP